MIKRYSLPILSFALALALLLPFAGLVQAHGKTSVGDYAIEIGFHNEPAYVNEPNSLDLFVTNSKTGKAVNGLESTLKAEIIFGASKKSVTLSPMDDVDGGYTAPVIPTAVGDYTWHIYGTIENTPADISMTSSPDTFVSVTDKTDDLFPSVSTSSASPATLIVAVIALVVGLAGLLVGLLALQAGRRNKA